MTLHYTQPVACIRGENGAVQGTGWLALGRYVVTCAHVVDDALKRKRGTVERPEETIQVDLPFLGKLGLAARVIAWFPARPLADLLRDPLADIAVLELPGDARVAGGIEPAAVDRRIPPRGTGFLTYGFPTGFDNGTEASGEVLVQDPGGWLQVRDTQGFGYFIQPGFSGAPVVSQADLRLIGMATAADRDKTTRLAFLLPAHLICRAFPPLAMPYRGLFAFGEEDADLFFGRADFVAQLQTKLERHSFAAVVGPSGSGKSSVVLAGLVPPLRQAGWNIAICRPLRDPLLQLALGLASLTKPNPADFSVRIEEAEKWARRLRKDPGRIVDLARQIEGSVPGRLTRTLVVIDQFEELFTQDAEAPDGAVARETTLEDGSPRQAQFLAVLEAIASQDPDSLPIRAVATMRVDFMGHALAIRRLAGLLQDTDVKLGPMTAAELSEAIRRPARTFGVEFEDGLAEELVSVMQGRAGGLPLLEFTLDLLWRRQQGRRLTWAAYRGPDGKGGLETALDEHAEEVLGRLGETAEASVRRVMLRLVRLGDDGAPDARAVARRSEIGEADWPLVQKLADGRSRLLTLGSDAATGEETAEVVHEALIGAWGRLRGWLLEDRDFGLWRQRLKESLQTWSGDSEDYDPLLRGRLLTEATDWLDKRGADLNDSECAFIKASREYARQEADEKLRQAQASEQLAHELAKGAQEREKLANELAAVAQENERRAKALAEAAKERETAAAQALREEEYARKRQRTANRLLSGLAITLLIALLVSVNSYSAANKAAERAEAARSEAAATARQAKGRQLGVEAIAIQRDQSTTESIERSAALSIEAWRHFPNAPAFEAVVTALREMPRYIVEHRGLVRSFSFSPKGDLLAIAGDDGDVLLIRTTDGSEAARIEHGQSVNDVVFSPRGDLFATVSFDRSVRLIRAADGREVARIKEGRSVNAVAFSAKGDLLAIAGSLYGVRLFRTADGREAARIEHEDDSWIETVAFCPNGKLLATGSSSGTVRLIRTVDTSETVRIEQKVQVDAIAFSPKGDMLAILGQDGSVRLIRTADGSEVSRSKQSGTAFSVAFSAKADLLAIISVSDGVRLIRTADGSEAARIGQGYIVQDAAFSPTDDLLAVGSVEGVLQLIRTGDLSEVARIEQDGIVNHITFSPNGDLLAIADGRSTRVISIADDSEAARVELGEGVGVAFGPRGDLLATAGEDGIVRLIRTSDGSEATRKELGEKVFTIDFSPRGDLLATGTGSIVRLTRISDGSDVARIEAGEWVSAVSFSPKGDLLATAAGDGSVRLIRTADGVESTRIEHRSRVWDLTFSPDGDLLLTAYEDGNVRLIRTADGTEAQRVELGEGVTAVAINPSGDLLATGTGSIVRLTRIADGSEVARIEAGEWVSALDFNPKGDLLAAASNQGVRLIRTSDGIETARVELGQPIGDVAFSPTGDLLATSGAGTVGLLLTPERVIEKLCRERDGRNFSAEEWQRYIGALEDWAPTCTNWRSDQSLLAAWQAKGDGR